MGQMTYMTVYDGVGVNGVIHELVPISYENVKGKASALWREQLANVPDSGQVTVSVSKETLKSGITRSVVRIEAPSMEATTGANLYGYTAAPKVAHVDTIEIVQYSHDRSTLVSRRLVRGIAARLLMGITDNDTLEDNGPVAELLDSRVMPV